MPGRESTPLRHHRQMQLADARLGADFAASPSMMYSFACIGTSGLAAIR